MHEFLKQDTQTELAASNTCKKHTHTREYTMLRLQQMYFYEGVHEFLPGIGIMGYNRDTPHTTLSDERPFSAACMSKIVEVVRGRLFVLQKPLAVWGDSN